MLNTVLVIIAIVSALINLILVTIRLAESICEARAKHPELTGFNAIVQVIKNFFTKETYGI